MALSEFWFLLVGVLFVGFMFLEGFDFGVGMSTKFLAKNETERQVVIKTIGPVWDANEVWLITAGGAMFAAFPHWYASVFSGYYLAFVLLLLALIVRGVSFEFRARAFSDKARDVWTWTMFIGSILPPFLFGVFFTSLIRGLPLGEGMHVNANFFGDIVNLYTVIGGITFVLLSYLHGLFFLTLKSDGPVRERAHQQAKKIYAVTGLALVAMIVMTYFDTPSFDNNGTILMVVYGLAIVLYAVLFGFMKAHKEGLSFTMTGLVIILIMSSFFIALFPNVLISTIDPMYDLTIKAAASGDYSLKLMTYVAITMVPIVLAYTVWTYYVFRKRITGDKESLEH